MNNLLEIIAGSNIAKDDFSLYVDSGVIIDPFNIKKYYDEKKEHADQLVLEDEFVGKTYSNLRIIKQVLKRR